MDKNKKDLKKAWKQSEREKEKASIPIPKADLKDLFDWLDRPDAPECDHTLKETIQFLKKKNLNIESTIKWLQDNGGYCDCEVIYNVEDKFGEIVEE